VDRCCPLVARAPMCEGDAADAPQILRWAFKTRATSRTASGAEILGEVPCLEARAAADTVEAFSRQPINTII